MPASADARAQAGGEPARIAVFRALNLGDMLCATPALRALRGLYPAAHITLVGLPSAATFQRRLPDCIDRHVAFPGYPGLPEARPGPGEADAFLARMRDEGLDLALQMHGSGPISNDVVAGFGARRAVGLGEPVPGVEVWPYPDDVHEIRRCLRLVQHLGAREADERMRFPLIDEDHAELAGWPGLDAMRGRRFVCLHPGARAAAKRWPPGCFAVVGDALAARGFEIVVTGSAAERPLAEAVAGAMCAPAVIAACDIGIGGLAALVAEAALLVSNDTGVAHLACALDVPSVVVFFATDPVRWGPLDTARHRVVHDPAGVAPAAVMDQAFAALDAARLPAVGGS